MTRGANRTDPDLLDVFEKATEHCFGNLRRTVRKNVAVLAVAFLRLLSAPRSGAGRLSLGALYRVLPTRGTPHAREKRLYRVLDNPRLDPRGVTDGLVQMVVGRRGHGLWPILFDQTKLGATQALVAGVPFEGRVLPLSLYTFDYPWQERVAQSQNALERVFLMDLDTALPKGVRAIYIGDRGYARAALLRQLGSTPSLYIIRGRVGTRVEVQGHSLKLGELPCGTERPLRYRAVYYQAHERVLIDVIAFHDPTFKEPWYLLVPSGNEALLPTDTVLVLYRERMQVEQGFRDFKTHLGLRGLKLKVRVAVRTGRLLLAFCIAYALALALGISPEAARARADLEIPRRTPRHGTCRTLSVLSLAMAMLAHPRWRSHSLNRLYQLVHRLAQGQPLFSRAPPQIAALKIAA